MLGGMLSVVWADVVQFSIMFVSSIIIGLIAMSRVDAATVERMVPEGWLNPFFGWNLGLDWSEHLASDNEKIASDGFNLFGLFFMMMLFKGVFAAMAGPAPNYDMQKILSTRSPTEACKMSGFVSVVLLFPRYFMITGFAVLAIVFFREDFQQMGWALDFEKVLPLAIKEFVPVGLMGLLLAGLFAADPTFERNTQFGRDMVNVGVGIVWQLCLTIVPIYIVLKQGLPLTASLAILGITSVILKKNWYDRLERR